MKFNSIKLEQKDKEKYLIEAVSNNKKNRQYKGKQDTKGLIHLGKYFWNLNNNEGKDRYSHNFCCITRLSICCNSWPCIIKTIHPVVSQELAWKGLLTHVQYTLIIVACLAGMCRSNQLGTIKRGQNLHNPQYCPFCWNCNLNVIET